MRIQFDKAQKIVRRMDKVAALAAVGTAEARKARKQMNVHKVRQPRMNLVGFYHPNGKHPVRCK